jgi:hypothetical protein
MHNRTGPYHLPTTSPSSLVFFSLLEVLCSETATKRWKLQKPLISKVLFLQHSSIANVGQCRRVWVGKSSFAGAYPTYYWPPSRGLSCDIDKNDSVDGNPAKRKDQQRIVSTAFAMPSANPSDQLEEKENQRLEEIYSYFTTAHTDCML